MPRIPRSKQAKKAQTQARKKTGGGGRDRADSGARERASSNAGFASSSSSSSSAGHNSEKEAEQYVLVGGREEVIGVWDGMSFDDKRDILNVEPEEIVRELQAAGIIESDSVRSDKLEELLNNAELMTAIRGSIVAGLHNEGTMEIPLDPLLLCIVRVVENHLLLAYARRVCRVRVIAFSLLFVWWILDWWWLLRYPLLGLLIYAQLSSRDVFVKARQALLLVFGGCTCFFSYYLHVGVWTLHFGRSSAFLPLYFKCVDDPWSWMSGTRTSVGGQIEGCADASMSALLCLTLATWVPWYRIVSVIELLPLVILVLEQRVRSHDENALSKIRIALSYVAQMLLLYFAWYSWLVFLFVSVFFFPTLTCWLLAMLALGFSYVLSAAKTVQSAVLDWNKRPVLYWLEFSAVLLWFLYALLWDRSSFSWMSLLLLLLAVLFLLPPLVSNVADPVLKVVGALLLQRGMSWVVFNAAKLSLFLGVLAFVFLRSRYRKCRNLPDDAADDEADEREREPEQDSSHNNSEGKGN